ncbi:MAG: alpha/beta fold hydrolase [Bacteriovoracaceae bacterium]|nr:alpha/beta fold hydrolase [Bacteriovoracaceae bacterium]
MEFIQSSITMRDGIKLWCRYADIGAKEWLIVTHGIAEYADRHNYIADLLEEKYNIFFWDLRGHGRSEGIWGDIDYFDQYMEDLKDVIIYLKAKMGMEDFSLYSHSMGALINLSYLQDYATKDIYPVKAFFSAPPAGSPGPLGIVGDNIPVIIVKQIMKRVRNISGKFFVDARYLSHDPEISKRYVGDKLNNNDPSLHLLLSIGLKFRDVFSRPLDIKCDFKCVIGEDDRLVTNKNLAKYFKNVEKDLEFKMIPHGYHEMYNETPEIRGAFFKELTDFFS